jgi:hypothetical protein
MFFFGKVKRIRRKKTKTPPDCRSHAASGPPPVRETDKDPIRSCALSEKKPISTFSVRIFPSVRYIKIF